MATDTLPSSLHFLTDAAHLLATTAPETSAHLMSQRNSLMFENQLHQSDVQRQHVCGCCGHIMIMGQGDVLKLETGRALRKKRKLAKGSVKRDVSTSTSSRHGCRKVITCGMCSRYTKINLPPATPVSRGRPKKQQQKQASQPMVTVVDTPSSLSSIIQSHANSPASSAPEAPLTNAKTSANANSKKRAKSRKQGLQALLQQSASSKPQLGFGLSMADFMKK
ncbi:hypothetical protein F4775DRAFT_237381 [Biscogniauxia sp. FL1348]|nr:hypothetical protein F4775DRAFT_237381 [Biscogniauxia sp. FL1348]